MSMTHGLNKGGRFSKVSKRFVDLTHPIGRGMPVWPGDPEPEIREPMTAGIDPCTVQTIRFSNHLGTHLDAPSHFVPGGRTVDEIPLEILIGPAAVLDFTHKKKCERIRTEDFRAWDGRLSTGARVLLKTGWDQHFRPGVFHDGYPCLDLEAAEFLASREIALLGMDTPSPSPIDDPGQNIHKVLLGAGIILLEAVTNLGRIQADIFELIVLSPPFTGFSGAPCRAVAVVEGDCEQEGTDIGTEKNPQI